MPYGMPKWMKQPETDQKMERCVANLKGQGKTEQSAIMICKAAIIREAKKGQS
ncbi:MAG TPA: hypothetical protein VHL57_12000 [Flavobacteriales bacterium]|jgi:hypothetical protein|nr:hypothetical protein [Flavobacteriales bacterium]